MKAVKEFCKDYAVLQEASNTFYKKHWKGVILMNVGVAGICVGSFAVIGAVGALKDKLTSKKNNSELYEEETEDESELSKSAKETFRVLGWDQRS